MDHGANIVKLSEKERLLDESIWKARQVPDSLLSRSEIAAKQKKQRLQQAVLYGKAVLKDRSKQDIHQPHFSENLFEVAFADFLNGPGFDSIDLSEFSGRKGSRIRIAVVKDFAVASVYVKIQYSDGSIADEGHATPGLFNSDWTFTASHDNPVLKGDKITITATDLPANEEKLEKYL
jgi:hypothetical protein